MAGETDAQGVKDHAVHLVESEFVDPKKAQTFMGSVSSNRSVSANLNEISDTS
jgi:hypothetical protein